MNSLQILDRLIGFATVSREPNLALIEYVQDYLAACGVACRLYRDPVERKANLYASVGPADRGGVLLSGHTDVVPVDGQAWSCDPFRLQQRGERLFARGAADMKGFLACALRAAALAAARPLQLPLQLAFSYDEEVGCLGVRSLIDDMARWHERPRFCIVGEPTALRIAVGHKGKIALRARCHGRAAHSAYPHLGVNAIHLATDLVGRIRERQQRIERHGTHDPAYAVPYTTLHVGVIRGGAALNIVPEHCELEIEIRHLASDAPQRLVDELRADADAVLADPARADSPAAARGRIDLEVIQGYPGLETPADSAVVELTAALTGHRECTKMDFGSEAGLFSERVGVPTVVCGPGSIEQAHQPDEFIALDQLQRCDAMLDALLDRLA
ncbi:MAG TPA: acetylornithine deacetylase [Steroidobacteraceae bacterium]|nr:acetylornithine deacetylase [Steroidobacteraceae bacterium]